LPYWNRIWTIQKIALSSRALFLVGDELLLFEAYKLFLDSLQVFLKPGSASPSESWFDDLLHNVMMVRFPTMAATTLEPLNAGIQKGKQLPLIHLLVIFKEGYAVSNPRELIFALLGVSKFAIKPDYTKTILDFYTIVAFNWVNFKFELCLDFLLQSGYGRKHYRQILAQLDAGQAVNAEQGLPDLSLDSSQGLLAILCRPRSACGKS
jgi:hypothetical protein